MAKLALKPTIVASALLIAATGCSGSPAPSGSQQHRSSTASAFNAWDILAHPDSCAQDTFSAQEIGSAYVAAAPAGNSGVVVVGSSSVTLVSSGRTDVLRSELEGEGAVTSATVYRGSVWVSGTRDRGSSSAFVEQISQGQERAIPLPKGVATIVGIASAPGGVIAGGVTANGKASDVLQLDTNGGTVLARLRGGLGAFAADGDSAVGTLQEGRTWRVFGGPEGDLSSTSKSEPTLPRQVGHQVAAAGGGVLAVAAVTNDTAGAPQRALVYSSRDSGASWQHAAIPGATDLSSLAVTSRGTLFAAVTDSAGRQSLLRSSNGTRWAPSPSVTLGDQSTILMSSSTALWVVTNRVQRIDN